ncbi:MAG TPA: c-type cytochrome [Vicinamibacterales bacterium]|nr:c-type cytochrome [Vicinamibacterales bacterium]
MRPFLRVVAFLAFLAAIAAAAMLLFLQGRGISARAQPSALEQSAALFMRGWMTPPIYKGLHNPVANSEENFVAAREHFADHCASCHANDGSGNTEMGRNLYPKAPDMRLPRTQNLSDGELFYIIENGVMLTGMPGWSTGTPEGEKGSWQLVHFIRRLPKLTPEDLAAMEQFNPISRRQLEEEKAIEEFLNGAEPPAVDPHAGHGKQ